MRALTLLFLASFLVLGFGCKKAGPTEVPVAPPAAAEPVVKKEVPQEVKEMVGNFQRVHFAFDSATLDGDSQSALRENAALMQKAPDVKVEVQGHADERGTTDYNLSLGQQRADSVQRFMVSQGIAPSRLTTISYGEERPLDLTRSEVAWSRNRRAEFRITWGQEGVRGTTE